MFVVPCSLFLFPFPCSPFSRSPFPFPVPRSLFPVPCSLFPVPCSLLLSRMPLRTMHLDSGRDWRGGQRQVFLLAQGLRSRGDEPLVVAPPESPLAVRLRNEGVAVSTVGMTAEWDLRAVGRIRALVRTWNPSMLHAHDARSHTLALAALVGSPLPLVVTRRVQFVPKGRLKYGPRVARFIAISGAVRDALVQSGVPSQCVTVVYSGVRLPAVITPRDWRRERGWPDDAIVCGVVGAMSAEKGLDLIASIASTIPPAVRDRIRLVLLGGRAAAGDLAVQEIAAFQAGFVEDIYPAMAGLDVLWHPSSAEGLGTAVIDAMALGVPPVTFAVGGLPEVVEHDVSGMLAPVGDTQEFARLAVRLVTEPALRSRLAGGARTRARLFTADSMIDGTARVYQSVLLS